MLSRGSFFVAQSALGILQCLLTSVSLWENVQRCFGIRKLDIVHKNRREKQYKMMKNIKVT